MRQIQLLGVSLVLAVAGCGGHSSITNPQPPPTSVTIEVRTAAGTPAAGADVQLASTVLVGGYLQVTYGSADNSGRVTFGSLAPNLYIVAASAGGNVAAETLRVTSTGPPVLPALRLVKPGAFRGRATLQGATQDHGVFVSSLAVFPLPLTETDPRGAFLLGGVPPGHWTVEYERPGFRSVQTVGMIASPGDTVELPAVTLVHAPPGNP